MIAIFALVSALSLDPAAAKPEPAATPAPTASAAAAQPSAATRYCDVYTPTGTRIRTKTCLTRAQWMAQHGFDPLNPDN